MATLIYEFRMLLVVWLIGMAWRATPKKRKIDLGLALRDVLIVAVKP